VNGTTTTTTTRLNGSSILNPYLLHAEKQGETDTNSKQESVPDESLPERILETNNTTTTTSLKGAAAVNESSIPNPYLLHAEQQGETDTNSKHESVPDESSPERILETNDTTTTTSRNGAAAVNESSIPDPYLLHAEQPREIDADVHIRQESVPDKLSPEQILETNDTTITSSPLEATTSIPHHHSDQHLPRLQEGRAVPSSRVGRAFGFASLGVGLAWGSATELASRLIGKGGATSGGSAVSSDENADRLAATLCRMRGAALKMGQMLSIQDESLLPPALTRALNQVRQGADAMPYYQLEQQLVSELGKDWRDKFETFDERPFAAASIGQVHRATFRDSDGTVHDVVVKVQYPGVAQSIESDLRNLSMLVTMTGLSPKGLFIDNVIRVGRDELKVECNYLNEMANQQAFQALVAADPILRDNGFVVPNVIEELTTEQIITSEYSPGGTIDKVSHLDADERNRIGRHILYLTMKELFDWRFMQTDPNWGNFLYDFGTQQTTLIDFGATREYTKSFVDGYLRIVWASANRDEDTLMEQSYRMGFLTGDESEAMLRAHKLSGFTVGEPFWTNDEPFDFQQSKISTRMSEHTSVFLKDRLV
jgi:aarF domain-containing kinase